MREEALVDSEQALGSNCAEQAIERSLIQRTSLIVHPAHDGIRWMHEDAYHDATRGTAGQV